ncbi:M15 family metallopeptidase [Streptomyces sp. H39-S7]|uniref:M15 family metallopeptidase n=1 Tax=Streptomyces sp. H39-S7 TaxID=3004357 RepID=UPI0022AEEC4A|nr:M15 family metallopeptidase [Streptomyces sp. H39-S7]MCZ4123010.1 M15 family metallopeptidase [Streptomyces sp. H39-S7]
MPRLTTVLRTLAVSVATLIAVTAGTAAAPAQARSGDGGGGGGPKAPKAFVALRDIDPTIQQEIRYFTAHNFVGVPIDGYRQPICLLTRPAAEALHAAQVKLLRRGYSLRVYDCYRPQRAVDHFVAWAKDLDDQRMKDEFYPHVDKSRLFEDGYIAEKSGHSRGSTLDVTIVRRSGGSVDMGTPFDYFDTLSHTLDPRIQGVQRENRLLLKSTLEGLGFVNLAEEWWHYTYKPERFPDTYFDFPVSRRSLTSAHVGP